jgi:dUTP pyrophosphatase
MPTGDPYPLERCCQEFNRAQQFYTAPLILDSPFPVKIKLLSSSALIPYQARQGDAGYDLYATESGYILPGQRALISTGIAISIPRGYYGRIAPRSGLAVKNGVDVLAGVIDHGFVGEVKVCLINLDNRGEDWGVFRWSAGDRIAQLIIEKCHEVEFTVVDSLEETARGTGGFGSTGS